MKPNIPEPKVNLEKPPSETPGDVLSANPFLRFFGYEHLSPSLQEIGRHVATVAIDMARRKTHSPGETEAGLRKLLEARDCFIRAEFP